MINETFIFNYSTKAISTCGNPPTDACLYKMLCENNLNTYFFKYGILILCLYIIINIIQFYFKYKLKKDKISNDYYLENLYLLENIFSIVAFCFIIAVVYYNIP